MTDEPQKTLQEIVDESKYPLDAFHFVRKGLDFTVQRVHTDPEFLEDHERHVSGQDLSNGLRDYAIEQYGHLAKTVLERWRITRTEDFGQIVFAMVNGGLMQATDSDSIEDFDYVFDFDAEFNTDIPLDRVPMEGFEHDTISQA